MLSAMTETLIAKYQIEPYRGGQKRLERIAVAFTGSPRGRAEGEKVLLVNDPVSTHSFIYEFRNADVVYVEEAPNLALPDGSAISMVRVWIKKGATALKIEPFHVEDTSTHLQQLF